MEPLHRWWRAAALIAALGAGAGCAHEQAPSQQQGTESPKVRAFPVSYQARLLTRRCEYLGVPGGTSADLAAAGANVGLAYVHYSSSSTYNNVTSYQFDSWTHVVALRCPPDVVQALEQASAPQGGKP